MLDSRGSFKCLSGSRDDEDATNFHSKLRVFLLNYQLRVICSLVEQQYTGITRFDSRDITMNVDAAISMLKMMFLVKITEIKFFSDNLYHRNMNIVPVLSRNAAQSSLYLINIYVIVLTVGLKKIV